MRSLLRLGLILIAISSTFLYAATDYKTVIPQELWPCLSYDNVTYMPASLAKKGVALNTQALAVEDSFDLRGPGTILRITAKYDPSAMITSYYHIKTPCQAKPGTYDLFDLKGVSVQAKVTKVIDVQSQTPTLYGSPQQLIGGNSYDLGLAGLGLVFGPLPASGAFIHNVKNVYVLKATHRYDLTVKSARDPYLIVVHLDLPNDADTGTYETIVERSDGLIFRNASFLSITRPSPPIVTSVTPDTLGFGFMQTLTISGTNLNYGVSQESYTYLNREIVKEVFLSHADQKLQAVGYPLLMSFNTGNPYGIKATFMPPLNYPTGKSDLHIVLNGRLDTTVVKNAVNLVLPRVTLDSVSPREWGQFSMTATISITPGFSDFSDWAFQLRKGANRVVGTNTPPSASNGANQAGIATVVFQLGPENDTGYYELIVRTAAGDTLTLPHAMNITIPRLFVYPNAAFTAGDQAVIRYNFLNISATNLSTQILDPQLCQDDQCLTATKCSASLLEMSCTYMLPDNQTPGIYDIRTTTRDTATFIEKKSAVLISPPGYLGGCCSDSIFKDGAIPYWTLKTGVVNKWTYFVTHGMVGCSQSDFHLENPIGDLTYLQGKFSWQPTLADTGWHFFSVSHANSCQEKNLYLAVHVENPLPSFLSYRHKPNLNWTGNIILGTGPSYDFILRLHLNQPGLLTLLDAQGHSLMSLGRFGIGDHKIELPPLVHKQKFLLLHIDP